MRRVCVFCGSSPGERPAYAGAARRFAEALAAEGLGLVYGGGRVGLMGVVADAALAAGCEVIGVIPEALQARELGHTGITELRVVESMHVRKSTMAELSDAFVALPGGLGTLEELFEVWTWAVLGLHRKPVGLLDVEGYWGPLITMVDRMVDEGFVGVPHRGMLSVAEEPAALLARLGAWQAPELAKWIRPDQT
ncbi:TIGR00730 family Rossman fold protein [Pseudenhygromyxa sp. WMMC2535]|uniref:LOG family protein n=1 Tax=Pseudenhygromyxa sp. WMMC2535 TaxID=2712867 RepID=UPI001554233E|nr:TIGR00730 family Rossman fold protein [Pseudenhygromyxa sp. WMMC2535]NVB42907.1 TIGR00730 family Rossman fold protein [Pseudenhygromyxa sp. WMMC2535]